VVPFETAASVLSNTNALGLGAIYSEHALITSHAVSFQHHLVTSRTCKGARAKSMELPSGLHTVPIAEWIRFTTSTLGRSVLVFIVWQGWSAWDQWSMLLLR
jgi:hypothetical protein